MKIIKPYIKEIMFYLPENGDSINKEIEKVARTCYQSHDHTRDGSDNTMVRNLRDKGHHAMLEFGGDARVTIVADRGLTHELVRHRIASFAQESTRYCNYNKGKFSSEITVIEQPDMTDEQYKIWEHAMFRAEDGYLNLIAAGVKAQIARSVLPIGVKSEINIKASMREWRHIFKMRCAKAAHPIIRGIMLEALEQFSNKIPVLFDDLKEEFLGG